MDDKKAEAIARGKRAELLLKDDLIVESLTTLEADYISAWKATPARDTDARERLWQAVQVVGKVRDHLTIVLNNGKLAQREVDGLSQPQKRGMFAV